MKKQIEFSKFGWEKAISVGEWRRKHIVNKVTYRDGLEFPYLIEYDAKSNQNTQGV